MSKSTNGFDMRMRPSGEMYVWLCAMGLAAGVIMVIGLLWIIVANGVEVFWPRTIYEIKLKDGTVIAASIVEDREKKVAEEGGEFQHEYKLFTGNKDVFDSQFRYVDHSAIESKTIPKDIMVAEREGSGNALFYPEALVLGDGTTISADSPEFDDELQRVIDEAQQAREKKRSIDRGPIGRYSVKLKKLEMEKRRIQKDNPKQSRELQAMERAYSQWNLAPDDQPEYKQQLEETYEAFVERGGPFAATADVHRREQALYEEYKTELEESEALKESIERGTLKYRLIDGTEREYTAGKILRVYEPNQFGALDKIAFFIGHFWLFLSEEPREANTEGGIFPAIFGTFVMTVLMSAAVMPFGVLAAIYLREYASQGMFTQAVRVAVNNLAGVPSIVYGVFGLGFFIYGMGSWIDTGADNPMSVGNWALGVAFTVGLIIVTVLLAQDHFWKTKNWMPDKVRRSAVSSFSIIAFILLGVLIYLSPFFQGFFSDRMELLNEPTFGTGGVLWASLTLALMTVPVVVVATEEALAAVPRGVREASLACGASKWQTIQRIVLPASASGVLTGLILAMARGAGEVAPLMLVGVIKHVEELPINSTPPFFHLEQKFMHMGFHIYDLGFQSPDSEAAKPMVFATTFLLIVLVVILNLGAILIRDHLRKKYASGTF